MSDTESKFNFTKAADQTEFEALPESEQSDLVDSAQVEATKLNEQRDVEAAVTRIEGLYSRRGYYRDETVFDNVGSKVALALIERGRGLDVAVNIERFKDVDRKEIMHALLEHQPVALAKNLDNFADVLDYKAACDLLDTGMTWYVAKKLPLFKDVDHEDIIQRFLRSDAYLELVGSLENFKGVNYKQLALRLTAEGKAWAFLGKLDKFRDLDEEVAQKLVEDHRGPVVLEHLESFSGVSRERIVELIDQFEKSKSK